MSLDKDVILDGEQLNQADLEEKEPEGPPPALRHRPGLLQRYPVLAGTLISLLVPVLAFLQGLVDGEPVRVALSALIGTVITVVGAVVQHQVTPVADPKLGPDLPLVIEEP